MARQGDDLQRRDGSNPLLYLGFCESFMARHGSEGAHEKDPRVETNCVVHGQSISQSLATNTAIICTAN